MRYAVLIALISLAALLRPQDALAQAIAFNGSEIISLANAIVADTAKPPYQLPSAYQLKMTNGHTMIITAPNAFELLCRTVIAWKETKTFPREIALDLHDLKGPEPDAKYEPKTPGLMIAVPTIDIGEYSPYWLKLAAQPGRTLPKAMVFPASYRLTPAQFLVAAAVLITETLRKNEFPTAVAMPLVRSPENWLSTTRPLVIQEQRTVEQPVVDPPIDLRILLNGIELSEAGPILPAGRGPLPPFCGTIHIELSGFGPVGAIRLLLDSEELRTYKGLGPHTYDLYTVPLTDGLHTLSATATNTAGKTFAFVFSFTVQNGRKSGFTPAEPESLINTIGRLW